MNEVLFNNIKSLCVKKGISISKLEKECGFGQGTIYKWKRVSPSLGNLQKVADYFKITINKLASLAVSQSKEYLISLKRQKKKSLQRGNANRPKGQ